MLFQHGYEGSNAGTQARDLIMEIITATVDLPRDPLAIVKYVC